MKIKNVSDSYLAATYADTDTLMFILMEIGAVPYHISATYILGVNDI